jgi:hypothetical protein
LDILYHFWFQKVYKLNNPGLSINRKHFIADMQKDFTNIYAQASFGPLAPPRQTTVVKFQNLKIHRWKWEAKIFGVRQKLKMTIKETE